ncbi:glycosyl hydrolase 115 family protein [Mucilaginibacter daejeonensis]|uniref:glycosyl hydrolase 115 family protein n=1 Tax=Mucilaginibacter daejeonensis TaxID=398049 RepID=UPI001D171712|nr:glycosyl hydrolase 115 family protein [Mucilaginibacter daejeonensis]UEG52263.1 glycosyl hydrolase 115 family protein [Mucilaginibacter daejeonensis]
MNWKNKPLWSVICLMLLSATALATDTDKWVVFGKGKGSYTLAGNNKGIRLITSADDWKGVTRAVTDLQADIKAVTGVVPSIGEGAAAGTSNTIIVGTIGRSKLIDELIRKQKINVNDVKGKWESSLTQVVIEPMPGVHQALVIAGSDKRGTIYGIYTLSAQMGVSPWYWWADVPIELNKVVSVTPGRHVLASPAVKYRGIFLNDEAPALTGWARKTFGGLNHKFYEKVFELLLRLKGNYLWPAMWGNAFNDDDKLNPVLADEYGIVMGTSHHEPMMRSQQEWKRYGKGEWNYQTNDSVLRSFWRDGIRNMGTHESIVTMAMRGDGDMPMSEESNIGVLERIVADQRKIIAEVTHDKPEHTPQLWALYKEVQDYYDKGMRVPDDITLLLCDDNWGNLRKLPAVGDKKRAGGYGIYYHFDYVGGPRNYKWLNTNPIAKVWEQMHLAYEYGVDQIWIVNVGDLKPMEFPIEFFLDYAYAPNKLNAALLPAYTRKWAEAQFGPAHAAQIADIITTYLKFNGRRKPELLSPDTYSLVNYREYETAVADYKELLKKAEIIEEQLPANYRDAYFELVLHPVMACSNLYEMYLAVAKNRLYAKQGRSTTNEYADQARTFFKNDSLISFRYNKVNAGGKWDHMMDQTHISYRSWNEPKVDVLPDVKTIDVPQKAALGVAIEGDAEAMDTQKQSASLPVFNAMNREHYIDVFNKGKASFDVTITTGKPWLHAGMTTVKLTTEQRVWIKAEWDKVTVGENKVLIEIKGAGSTYQVMAMINKAQVAVESQPNYLPRNSYLALEAERFSTAVPANGWTVVPDLGRTRSGVFYSNVTEAPTKITASSPHLEYTVFAQDTGKVTVKYYLSPTLDILDKGGLRFAVSIDNEEPEIMNMHAKETPGEWNRLVANSIREMASEHHFAKAGKHVLKFWRIDPGVVLQKIVFDTGGVQRSYLGPPPYANTTNTKAKR